MTQFSTTVQTMYTLPQEAGQTDVFKSINL